MNSLSDSPIISAKINKIGVFFKSVALIIVILAIAIGGFLLNVQHEQNILLQQKVLIEKSKVTGSETGIVLDTTADIIKREGNVPIAVAKKYAVWIFEAGLKYNIDPLLILSVMSVESKFDYKAISPTGPIGLLQVAYTWHKEKTTQVALFDPRNNINVGTQILKEYSDKSATEAETLLRFNGSLGSAPVYAVKVLSKKRNYEDEIMKAVVKTI